MDRMSFVKDPQARLDFTVDWSRWLAPGETIAASEWDVPAGLELDTDGQQDTTTTVWLVGGTAGQRYRITNEISTTAGRVEQRSLTITCSDR